MKVSNRKSQSEEMSPTPIAPFSAREIVALASLPWVLNPLADWHEAQITMMSAHMVPDHGMRAAMERRQERKEELRRVAAQLGPKNGFVVPEHFQLLEEEIEVLHRHPEALAALADWYEHMQTLADAQGHDQSEDDPRKQELQAEAKRLNALCESGQ